MTSGRRGRYTVDGFRFLRVIMVLSSLSPLFVLWAIRGTTAVPEEWFILTCTSLAVLPTLFLHWRIRRARVNREKRQLTVGNYDDSRQHLLVYLFANLLPFYNTDIVTYRDLAAMAAALGIIVFLFWHLKLHYINVLFAVLGYRVFTVYPPLDGNPYTGREPFMLITARHQLSEHESITAHRITDTVYLEITDDA